MKFPEIFRPRAKSFTRPKNRGVTYLCRETGKVSAIPRWTLNLGHLFRVLLFVDNRLLAVTRMTASGLNRGATRTYLPTTPPA